MIVRVTWGKVENLREIRKHNSAVIPKKMEGKGVCGREDIKLQ